MASQAQDVSHESAREIPPKNKQDTSLNERFFRYFQQEITALQEQMERLAHTSSVGGESRDAVDHCLAGISRLSNEVQDASTYVPPYDQRIYAEAIKALQDKLAETRAAIAPRQKFSFKTARKNRSAISLADLAELDAQGRRQIPGYQLADTLTAEPSSDVSKAQGSVANDMTDNSALGSKQQDASLRNGLRTTTNVSPPERSGVTVDSRSDVHFKLPKSTSSTPVPASVASIRRSIINMSAGHAFAVLSVKDVSDSLLLCEEVNGAAHVTNVKRSVIVVTCHQFRMHDCNNVDVYLGCSSVPIIENCHGIRFSHISDSHPLTQGTRAIKNSWTRVDDFSWLKPGQSPNWIVMNDNEAISTEVWTEVLSSDEGLPLLEKVLQPVGGLLS